MNEDDIGTIVVKTAIVIHRQLGPGLLETVYEAILAQELKKQALIVERQVPVTIEYGDTKFEEGFRADLIIDHKVILELKSVETTNNIHKKQLLTYLRLTGLRVGYLLNFGEELMRTGITRIINGFNK